MNVNEYGIEFVFGTGYDMSAYTDLTLTFIKPDLTELVVTNPDVSISSSPLSTTLGTFAGDTYALYTFVEGDIDQAGTYHVRLTYDAAGPVHLISNSSPFTVSA